jgi:hypothetical protein
MAALMLLGACAMDNDTPDFAQPYIDLEVERKAVSVDGQTVNVGPEKDYEQDSDVTYQLTVSSEKKLSKLLVATSADAIDLVNSKILRTVPANLIDKDGNFTQAVNDAVIYYQYRIHTAVPPGTRETVTFTAMDEFNHAGSVSKTHSVIKKGSTQGRLLNVIDMSYVNQQRGIAMGMQSNLHYDEAEWGYNPDRSYAENRGPFFSLKHGMDIQFGVDAIAMADDIDFVGYMVLNDVLASANIAPLVNNAAYLVSPSDSLMLYSAFVGSIPYRVAFMATVPPNSINPETELPIANTPLYIPKLELTYAGITKVMQFYRDNNTTVSAFRAGATNPPGTWPAPPQPGYLQEYRDAGIEINATGNRLEFRILKPFAGYEPPTWKSLEGGMDASIQEGRVYHKNNILRQIMMEMYQKLRSEGKTVKVVKFLRLDNRDDASQVTPEYFDQLTHDNELDVLLAEVEKSGDIRTGTLALNQVYGFVSSDGKRGLIRTSVAEITGNNGSVMVVPAPNGGQNNVYGMIKFQMPQ